MSSIKVAAIQDNLNEFNNLTDLNNKILKLVSDAVNMGAQILVFPEDVGLWIESITENPSPRVENFVENIKSDEIQKELKNQDNTHRMFSMGNPCTSFISPFVDNMYYRISLGLKAIGFGNWISQNRIVENYKNLFQKMAYQNKIVIVGGSVFEQIGSDVFSVCYVFDRNGDVLGPIKKGHLTPIERGFCHAGTPSEIKVVHTQDYRIGACICYDLNFPDHIHELTKQGAQIICAGSLGLRTRKGSIFNPKCDAPQLERAKENKISIVRAYQYGNFLPKLTGNFIHLYLDGLSDIVDPEGAEINFAYPLNRDMQKILVSSVLLK